MSRKIIIDTDPGQDDAVALLLALASPHDLDVLGIVAVAGNVPLDLTAKNALKIVELSGRPEIPVYAGAARPFRRQPVTAEAVHGKTGLDGASLPEPTIEVQPTHGADFLVGALSVHGTGEVTLCALGPLTDLALALIKAPQIAPRIREIVVMGGGHFEGGNITPAAEFNIFADPEAADVVLSSGAPVTLVPLDVTHKVLCTTERLSTLKALGNRAGAVAADLMGFTGRAGRARKRLEAPPLHDPCVIAYLLRPDLFEGRRVNVAIETASELTAGMTVVDFWGVTDRPPNANFLTGVDAEGLFTLLNERLALLP